jgi:ABC-type cobalamin transport system permease subunit
MDITVERQKELRTWIFFLLIVLVALLWATFLLTRGEMLYTSVALAIIATFMSSFAFTFTTKFKQYIYLNLIIFAAVLWASFLLIQGVMIYVSLFMYAVAGCINIFAFLWVEQHPDDVQFPELLTKKEI